jgi:hypothetical protein
VIVVVGVFGGKSGSQYSIIFLLHAHLTISRVMTNMEGETVLSLSCVLVIWDVELLDN